MKSIFLALARALEAVALLCVAAASLPPLLEHAEPRGLSSRQIDEVVLACLVFLAASFTIQFLLGLKRGLPGLVRGLTAFWQSVHPRRGLLGRWYHDGWCEPLATREQAREALALHYGYRLPADGYEVARVRPAIRGGRLGMWVTVQKRQRRARHWACQYVRWVGDPKELWLLRSSLRAPSHGSVAEPTGAPLAPIPLAGLEDADIERILRDPAVEPKSPAFRPLPA